MRYTFPQFAGIQPKVVGPFTFRQFISVAAGIGAIFLLYSLVGKKNFPLFLLSIATVVTIVVGLGFAKIEGKDLTTVIKNLFKFGLRSKVYLWKKTDVPMLVFKKFTPRKAKKEDEEDIPLKIAGGSQLKRIKTQIEMKTK